MSALLMVLLIVTSVFLILLVLVQRGKGGGLAGAFGGMGGQSAFGTKAGDLFTKITIGVAFFWIVLCIVGVKTFASSGSKIKQDIGSAAPAPTEGVSAAPDAPAEQPEEK